MMKEPGSPGMCSAILEHAWIETPGAILIGGVRRRLVRRFPYSVLYAIKSDHIRLLAVMHAR